MPFDSSLPDEVAPGEATALRCKYWNVPIGMRCKLVYDHPGIHKFDLTNGNEPTEPKGSGSSSPDDECRQCRHARRHHDGEFCAHCAAFTTDNHHAFVPDAPCRCGHPRAGHSMGPCLGEVLVARGTDRENCRCRAFVPAAGETAGEPEAPELCEIPHETTEDEDACEAAHLAAEPEAPELRLADLGKLGAEPECNDAEGCHRVIPCDPGCAASSRALRAAMAAPPPRPPYAVAYVTGSGARIELALPGEASCAVIDGALVICHPSQVLGIAEVKPWEGP